MTSLTATPTHPRWLNKELTAYPSNRVRSTALLFYVTRPLAEPRPAARAILWSNC